MNRITNILKSLTAFLCVCSIFACTNIEDPDYREKDYGYVQFKLYKTASYEPVAKATKGEDGDVLTYLADATKIKVELTDGKSNISQTLVLIAIDGDAAEYGLRSEKLRLLAGRYTVVSYSLYGNLDQKIYESTPQASSLMNSEFTVVPGGLHIHDLLANTVERGKISFTLVKDTTNFVTKANNRQREYTFDEIKSVDIALRNDADRLYEFKALPAEFDMHFLDNGDDTDGYRTSTVVCDTLLSIPAGTYTIDYYVAYDDDKGKSLLERNENVKAEPIVVKDNALSKAKVPVRLYESDAYIQDYYALKEIWEALDGPNWYYSGQDFPIGCNWDFNKDVDLWGDQPGVALHSNGRVAQISISDFGFKGELPEAISKLTELTELYLGTHNDMNQNEFEDPTVKHSSRDRMENHKKYLAHKYPMEQMSEPIARALKENNITIPEIALYETMTEDEIIDKATGKSRIQLKDVVQDKLYNGLTKIHPSIWTLNMLEKMTIANGLLEEFPVKPADLETGLTALTDLEIYNCREIASPINALKDMPSLVSLNLSQNNKNWTAEEANALLNSIATGKSAKKIQILYMNNSNLTKVDGSVMSSMKSLGLLDLSNNNITEVVPFGKDINLVQLHLNNNKITKLERGADGHFCGMADVETFSVSNNLLTEFPDIFDASTIYGMTSVNFSYNNITKFAGYDEKGKKVTGNKGIYVETLSLTNNPITTYPEVFKDTDSKIAYINMRGCMLDSFADSVFTYDNAIYLTSFDFSYNRLKDIPSDFHAGNVPYLYGLDISYNGFSKFPMEQFDMRGLTVFAIRGQRDDKGNRCLRTWPNGVYSHVGLRGLYLGSNDIRIVDDTISPLCYYLEISDNPNIVFDASDICYEWQMGAYILIYDKTQEILNCDLMLQ